MLDSCLKLRPYLAGILLAIVLPAYVWANSNQSCGPLLTSSESESIRKYSSIYHLQLNSFLRARPWSLRWLRGRFDGSSRQRDKLIQAISKLPKYQGIAYRGAFLPRGVVDEMIAKKKLVDPGFLSASQTDRVFPVYDKYDPLNLGQVRIHFTIKSKSGRILGELSNMLGIEEEIVFLPNTIMKLETYREGEGFVDVSLEEGS